MREGRERLIQHIRSQAAACAELGSPLYADLLSRLADDVAAGGPGADVLAGYQGRPGRDAVSLRLMGGVHRLVLSGRAPELAAFYPSVGGDPSHGDAWPAFRRVLVEHGDDLVTLLDQPPQTNEVGRAAALVGVLQHLAAVLATPIRLVEVGASAGLNLWADHYRVVAVGGSAVGPEDSPVVLDKAWTGRLPPTGVVPQVVDRVGCDPAPIDPRTETGRLRLMSYVWPDQAQRLRRLRSALGMVSDKPHLVRNVPASQLLGEVELVDGATTLVWHSVMWQYLPEEERIAVQQRLDALSAAASARQPFARASLEPHRPQQDAKPEFQVRLQIWPGAGEQLMGVAAPHGVPTVWT